ncbi:MAG: ribonucleoside-diphosphate reductase subunit alpha [Elusimicrobia bacterium]|nr:ribonucleoside-diphosphate reductase subunit alpha [Elusimicrobiota bacterium]
MRVKKRDGGLEPVDVNKIVRAVARSAGGLPGVDVLRVATRTIGGLYDGATTRELDELSIQTSASLIAQEPEYSLLAARLLSKFIEKEVSNQNIHSFSQSIAAAHSLGLVADETAAFVAANARKLNHEVEERNDELFEYFGLRTVYDRYLLRHPKRREVLETAQYFFLRVACGLSKNVGEALELFRMLSSFDYVTSSPTLFNSGTRHPQMSSCYLVDSPQDNLESIYDRYKEVALLSKFSGGIAMAFHRIRSRGALIRGTNGKSNGVVPWLKTLDASVAAVNQGGKRKGACCVYLETWHADIEEFLELRDNTGDAARRTHNLNLANWVPDLFMKRVEEDGDWSLFDPAAVPNFPDLWGEAFEKAYTEAEAKGLAVKKVKARELYARMMRTLAETGNGWMTFKDTSSRACNQTAGGAAVHSSNLCTEILEVNNDGETAVCNLGSINLGRHVSEGQVDFGKLAYTVRAAVRFLDRVVDLNFYPTKQSEASNRRWRPVGLGVMGLQDMLFQLRLPFDSDEAKELTRRIAEEIYYHALMASCELAEESGAHESFKETWLSKGKFHFELMNASPRDDRRWNELRARIEKAGVRNSLMIAIAPTATIASIAGCYECIEPQVSNLFKRETLSGEFLQVNRYLVADLKKLGLWTEETRDKLKAADGSVRLVEGMPEELKKLYRTAWELPQRALIEMAAERAPFIDQSQSLNLFLETPTIGKLSSMYMHAWKRGLKTTYYLRSRPATSINKATTAAAAPAAAVACSLENPESCESCQ